jgi:hypothetical protein
MIGVTEKPRGCGASFVVAERNVTGYKKTLYASSRISQHLPFTNTTRPPIFAAGIVG